MDKMCNTSELDDPNKTIPNAVEGEDDKNRSSPVFKCFNQPRTVKGNHLDSSEYDIPSYQMNQSVRSRTSGRKSNETSECVLPFTPTLSPIPVASAVQFQPPSIHSLGTVSKCLDKNCRTEVGSSRNHNVKQSSVFENLGMTDKDISWVSAMATPPPKQVPGSEFNTIERATFFPEEKFQNIQPRALFSPTLDDDFGCHPISFTSESEDGDEEYKSNIRLSDVCATLKHLEVKSLDLVLDNSIIGEKDGVISPVIRTRKKKLGKEKKKGLLVLSPENKDEYVFSVGEDLSKKLESEKVKLNSGSDFLDDDSFQSMSFSGIDELCKTLVSEQSNTSRTVDCDNTLVNYKSSNVPKKFYSTKTTADVYTVSSMDNLHSYAMALEECDKCNQGASKIDQPLAEKGIVRLDMLNKDATKVDATKRLHSEVSEENDRCREKKIIKVDDENSGWENVKHYLSESQLNVSDGEIFRTVENLEKTLASQENKEIANSVSGAETTTDSCKPCKEDSEKKNNDEGVVNILKTHSINIETIDSGQNESTIPFVPFTADSGVEISVLEKDLNKAEEIFDENLENKKRTNSDGSDKQIQNAQLEESKLTKSNSDDQITVEAFRKSKFSTLTDEPEKTPGNQNLGFFTGLGKQINISDKAFEKAKIFLAKFEADEQKQVENPAKEFLVDSSRNRSSKSQVTTPKNPIPNHNKPFNIEHEESSEKNFHTRNSLMSKALMPDPKENVFKGFSTGSGKTIQVSAEALKKAQSLLKECEKECNQNPNLPPEGYENSESRTNQMERTFEKQTSKPKRVLTNPAERSNVFKGFSTGSGKTIQVSAEALKKAQSLLRECEKECNENPEKLVPECIGTDQPEEEGKAKTLHKKKQEAESSVPCFTTASGSKVKISTKALEAAKQFWSNTDETSETLPHIEPHEGFQTGNSEASKNETTPPNPQTSVTSEPDDWDEIIPSWLHVYNTSPSIASERIDLSPLVSHEDGNSTKPDREYIVKSPILGSGDRFHGKRKRRKLKFEDEKKPEEKKPGGFVVPYKNTTERKTSAKRTSNLPIDFSVPFKKVKFVEEPAVDLDVKGERARAREEQEKVIQQKQKVKPSRGSHLSKKCTEKQIGWRDAVEGCSPEVHSDEVLKRFGISEDVLQINIENSGSFRFTGENFFGSVCTKNTTGLPVGDGCLLILDDDNKFGVEELKRAFLASPGVQPNLVADEWVENHLKWIVWKLAHYERAFPRLFAGRCLTPHQMMLQLKYRYDREIDRNERSALKKILERDDTSVKRLVLCVCGIKKVTVGVMVGYELKLTDGWYSCPAHSDPAMARLIEEGKIVIGTKLQTQGAILVNCEQGVSPLEINGDVYLKISTNSTRRARWDAKLGFQKNPENFPISLGSVLPQGGVISRIDVIIVRIYPRLYMEKTSDGRHVTRNRRSEEKADSEHRRLQEERMEMICHEVQTEMKKSNCLSNMEDSQEVLSGEERKRLENLQSNQNDRLRQELREKIDKKLEKEKLTKRNVSEFVRAKIVDFRKPDYNNPAILCVWNPNEDLSRLLTEGKVFSVMNVTISNSSRIYKPLQINTTRQTQYRPINRHVKYPARKLTQLKDVSSKVCPVFEEVDVVGMVTLVQDVSRGSRTCQVFYLTDLEMNFAGVVFWGSCKDHGWENALKIHSVIACSNLQWKKSTQNVPSLYVNEHSVFTENPKHPHLKEEMERLKKNIPKDKTDFLSKCEECLRTKLDESVSNTSKNSSSNGATPKFRAVNGFESKPTASSTPMKPFTARIGGSEEAEPSPIQKRIEKLQSYGEPPSLLPLFVRNNPKRKFRKPVKSSIT